MSGGVGGTYVRIAQLKENVGDWRSILIYLFGLIWLMRGPGCQQSSANPLGSAMNLFRKASCDLHQEWLEVCGAI